ncbi:DNA directed RNA polymerase subunit L [Cotonvirus japonicus]|uniref:DNA directed RNA polymerase subunit L n=1 Tax=Cotonvirus japonicus TaxID=2811091 RepID=A0ABM7NSD2_9VIRU|nr:DNA directed RNA polymerase subunit L [Cotonvirus japonicus]BCS83068.1 DNA directed RNA polymerase subunit L [Cotonvirus japonicus]
MSKKITNNSTNKSVIKPSVNTIDVYGKPNIKLNVVEQKKLNDNWLYIEIEGPNVDNTIVNAIRRTILLYIPIYGFHRSNIFIEANRFKNMYNFDLIYNIFETLPIFDVPNHYDLENPETFLTNEVMRNIFGKFIQDKYNIDDTPTQELMDADKKLFKIELTLNLKNNTGDYRYVSSHDCVLKIDGKISNSYTKREPIYLLVLKPSEEISLRAEANLGIAKIFAAYEATTNATHEEINANKWLLKYKTLEQLDKYTIFNKACVILYKKLENLQKYIIETYDTERDPKETITINLHGEEHTIGTLLERVLQLNENVEKAGYKMPHPFIDEIVISYKLYDDSKIGPIKIFTDCTKYLIKVFKTIADISPNSD